MDKCGYHDKIESTVEAIEQWKAVDNHRQDTTDARMEKICNSIVSIEKRLAKIEASLPAIYETRAGAEAAYTRLHARIDTLRIETDAKMRETVKNTIAVTGIVVGTASAGITIIINLLMG